MVKLSGIKHVKLFQEGLFCNCLINLGYSFCTTITILVFLMFFLSAEWIYAEKRAIALVFDDSGSMKGNPYQAVNYATQLLVGLLNPEDSLHIIRMSNPGTAIKIPLDQKQKIIGEIRNWELGINTPFQSVKTAMEDLLKNTFSGDKWLIIFTDGKMKVEPHESNNIKKFLTESGAKSIILNINIEKNQLSEVFKKVGLVDILKSSTDFRKISESMEFIALSVMGMPQSGLTVSFDENIVKINTIIPLKKLIILQQELDSDRKLLEINQSFDLNNSLIPVTGSFQAFIERKIFGKVSHITNTGDKKIIPAGEIKIVFNGKPNAENFKFLPEVAVELTAKPEKGFQNVSGNIYDICNDSKYIPIIAELKTQNGSLLPQEILENTHVQIHYNQNSERMELENGRFVKTISVENDLTPVSVSAKFPGYFNFKTNIFTLKKIPCEKPDVLHVEQNINYPSIKVTELESAPFLAINPKINGDTPDHYAFKKLKIKILKEPDIKIEFVESQNCWKVRPRSNSIFSFFEKTGDFEMFLEISSPAKDSIPVRTLIKFKITDASFLEKYGRIILWLLIISLLDWYLFGIFKRPRFCKGSEIIYQRITNFGKQREITNALKCRLMNRIFVPYSPETVRIQGMKFKAGKRCSYIELAKEVQTDHMYIAGNMLEDPRKRDQRISTGDEVIVEFNSYKESYKYKTQ